MEIGKVLVFNLAVIAIFVAMAYFFGKWWLSLLSLLFIMTHAEDIYPIEIEGEDQEEEDNSNE